MTDGKIRSQCPEEISGMAFQETQSIWGKGGEMRAIIEDVK